MKKLFLLLPLAAMLSFAACENGAEDTDADDNDTIMRDDADTTVIIRERETYRTNLEREIDSLQMELDSFGNRTEAKTSTEWRETKTDIQMRLDRAKADLQEFGNKTDNEWDEFKTGVDRRMDTLRMEWDSFKMDIKVDNKQK